MQQTDLTSDFFALFGLPASFDIDTSELTTRYREMQRAVHPDKFVSASDAERRLSMQMAARINEGYQVMRDPLARSRYLLELRGIQINDVETTSDSGFLMEQIELRERLAELSNADNPDKGLQDLKKDISEKVEDLTVSLGQLLKSVDDSQLKLAVEVTKRLQFFRKLEEEASELEERLLDY